MVTGCGAANFCACILSVDMKPTVSNFLISCLCGIYIFQFYNGYRLLVLYFTAAVDCPHWQVGNVLYGRLSYVIDEEGAITIA